MKRNYLKIFPTRDMACKWKKLQQQYPELKCFHFTIEHVLIGHFHTLASIYETFTKSVLKKHIEIKKYKTKEDKNKGIKQFYSDIAGIFDYAKYQPVLSAFFMNPQNGFNISTCHYCNLSYINAYGMGMYYKNKLEFLNQATKDELQKYIGCIAKNADKIRKKRPYISLNDFNSLPCWRKPNKSDDIQLFSNNHFDLDHVLDKGACPIISLALMNFVPSCQICNQRLKHTSLLGHDVKSWCKLSPTSPLYNFDQNVKIRVMPISHISPVSYIKNSDNFHIIFDCQDGDYQHLISLLKLKDRYNYHKIEALRILDLRQRYQPTVIFSISKILHRPALQIYEDLFGAKFSKEHHRCFDKLKRDILHPNY